MRRAWARAASRQRVAPRSCRLPHGNLGEQGMPAPAPRVIARHAKVNKALIHYYFKDKETLYGAVWKRLFGIEVHRLQVLDSDQPVRERFLLTWAYSTSRPKQTYPKLMQREMMRAAKANRRISTRSLRTTSSPSICGSPT